MSDRTPLPADTRMGPVTLGVRDLDASLRFYEGLGFRALASSGDAATLGADKPVLRLVAEPASRPRPRGVSGLYHVAYLLPSREDLGALVRRIAQERLPIQGASDHLVSEALYLGDPDGHGIEIYADRPRDQWTWEQARLHMATLPLDVQDLLSAAGGRAWKGLPTGSTVGHVHLNVGDVRRAEAFYRDGLGFDVTAALGDVASFLSAGGYHHHLAVNSWEGRGAPPPPAGTVGLRSYAVEVPGRNAVSEVRERLGLSNEDELARDPAGNAFRVVLA
jgi:catechol 2,3-dioxygenase